MFHKLKRWTDQLFPSRAVRSGTGLFPKSASVVIRDCRTGSRLDAVRISGDKKDTRGPAAASDNYPSGVSRSSGFYVERPGIIVRVGVPKRSGHDTFRRTASVKIGLSTNCRNLVEDNLHVTTIVPESVLAHNVWRLPRPRFCYLTRPNFRVNTHF